VKVAFSGTHGVGKTSMVRRFAGMLEEAGLKTAVLEEVARRCPLPVNEAGTGLTQAWMLACQVAEEARLEASGVDVVVADRCVFDHVAYARWLHRQGRVSDCELKFIEEAAVSWAKARPYFAIVFLQPSADPEPDGFRSTSRAFQLGVHEELERLYAELSPLQLGVRVFMREPLLQGLCRLLKQSCHQGR